MSSPSIFVYLSLYVFFSPSVFGCFFVYLFSFLHLDFVIVDYNFQENFKLSENFVDIRKVSDIWRNLKNIVTEPLVPR